jgi:uncharacterized membrane protein YGL010W
MRKIDSLLSEYAESHQTKFNKAIHYVCVPAIFFSIIGLLASIPAYGLFDVFEGSWISPFIHFGTGLIIFGLIYYLRLSVSLFIGMLLFSAFVLYGVYAIDSLDLAPLWLIMLIIFAVSWVFQFIGHKHEGKKSSFLKDLQFLMIGPAWTLSHLYDYLGLKF